MSVIHQIVLSRLRFSPAFRLPSEETVLAVPKHYLGV